MSDTTDDFKMPRHLQELATGERSIHPCHPAQAVFGLLKGELCPICGASGESYGPLPEEDPS